MVLAFAERGADVVIASRKLDACEALAAEVERARPTSARRSPITPAGGTTAIAARGGVRRVRTLRRARQQRRDVAAVPELEAVTEELYDKVMDVNLKGPFRLSALVGTRMAGPDHGGSDGGSIIFVSSIASQRPSPNELVYGAAKAGVNNLTYGSRARSARRCASTASRRARSSPTSPRHGTSMPSSARRRPVRSRPRRRTARDRRHGALPRERRVGYTTGAVIDVDGGPR